MGREDYPKEALLSWLTDFDNPVVIAARGRSHPPLSTRLVTLLLALCGGSVASLTLVLAALTRPIEEEAGQAGARMPPPSAQPMPTPSASLSAAPPSIVPDSCDGLYSENMATGLTTAGLQLRSEWDDAVDRGSADSSLRRMLDEDDVLDCYWVDADDDEAAALLTVIAEVDEEEALAAKERLAGLGYTELAELGGVRFVTQAVAATGKPSGESHFFRDGLWFATRWYGHGPYGYTADMVARVFR